MPWDPVIPFLGVPLPKVHMYVHYKSYIRMFIVSLFLIPKKHTKNEKQLECSSLLELINMW